MKIVLISTGSKNDKGPRAIARYLEENNHKTEVIFFDEKIIEKVNNAGLIVVSANMATFKKASKIIRHLKKLNKPIAYAGIYPFLYPTEAIKETDLVIIKNPAETILELANRIENFQKISDVPNLWFKASKEEIMKNA